jgi:hypothetical protein
MSGSPPKAITNEGVNGSLIAISPDGKQIALVGADQKPALLTVEYGRTLSDLYLVNDLK